MKMRDPRVDRQSGVEGAEGIEVEDADGVGSERDEALGFHRFERGGEGCARHTEECVEVALAALEHHVSGTWLGEG